MMVSVGDLKEGIGMQKLKLSCEKFLNTGFTRFFKYKIFNNPKFFEILIYIIASLLLLIGLLRYWEGPLPYNSKWDNFYTNIHAELIGIGVTILAFNSLSHLSQIQMEKRRLILQMGSPDNSFAIEAVRQLRSRGWLLNGTLNKADLSGANLQGAELALAHMKEANLMSTHLEDAYLAMAHVEGGKLMEAHLDNAHFEMAYLRDADLRWAQLIGTHLEGAHMQYARLDQADLSNTHIEGADLKNASLFDSILDQASFINAHLQGTDLRGIRLTNADLTGAKYNQETHWPKSFDPEAAGCILVEDE